MTKIEPVRGWALDRIVELDEHFPGVAGSFLRASPERRQVVACFLAAERAGVSDAAVHEMPIAERAKLVANADHRTILVAGYGSPPRGLRGALGKAGSQPHCPRFYSYLYQLLAAQKCKPLAAIIGQMPRVNMVTLKIARQLPEDLQSASLISAIEDVQTAKDISTLTDLIVGNGIDRAALAEAIRQVRSPKQLSQFWTRWCLKTVFPAQPVIASPVVRPVTTAAELRRIGLKYQNCAERYISEALEGRAAFCEFTGNGRRLVVQLQKSRECWVIEDVHASHNGPVRRDAHAAVVQHFAALGISERTRRRPIPADWSAMKRLTMRYDFGEEEIEE